MTKGLPPRSDTEFSRIVKIIVCWFKIIGLAPFSFEWNNNSTKDSHSSNSCGRLFLFSKIGMAHNILLGLLITVLGVFAVPELSSMHYPNKSSITHVIDVAHGILRTGTICVIVVFGAFTQKKAISIMNRLFQIDSLLSGMKGSRSGERTSFVYLGIEMMIDGVLWVIFWASEEVFVKSFLHCFIFNVPIFLMHWYIIEYSIVLGLVAREYESLNNILSDFEEFPNHLFHIPVLDDHSLPVTTQRTNCSQLAVLKSLHKIRTTLSEVSQDIADFFSIPTLPTVACFSLTLIYNFYYFVVPIIFPSVDIPISTNINSGVWILACIYPLILLSTNVMKTLNEAKLTGLVIHKLLANVKRQDIQTLLERFSLQLVHENISFTAYGFLTLDFTVIQSIFGVTVTYLVIMIQFMQSAANTSNNTSF